MPDAIGLPFGDTADFEAADRGLIDAGDPVVRNEAGQVIWDNGSYGFLTGEAPDTVHPSLWRQSTLVARQGLFEVTDGIYQVRGYDLSNMSVIEGDTGIIIIDPLISTETAAAALALYRKHRGDRPAVAVIHTHSHADHFGGVKGVVSQADVDAGRVQIIAPEGFVEHAIAENVYAGTAMARRAGYMYGAALPRGPKGGVGAGLGQTTSTGTVTLIDPTVTITTTGQELTVDGVRMVFQMAPGTEAPAEMHFYFPDRRALCMAENATHNLHNLLTLRGALVRDPHVWAHYLTEAIELFAGQSDVVFASHHWPTWGTGNIIEFLSVQRDLYAYLHDQTLRLLNQGYTGPEIAEMIELPPAISVHANPAVTAVMASRIIVLIAVPWTVIIVPRASAGIRHPDLDATNVPVRGVGHMSLPIDGRVTREIASALAQLESDGTTVHRGVTHLEPTPPRGAAGPSRDRRASAG